MFFRRRAPDPQRLQERARLHLERWLRDPLNGQHPPQNFSLKLHHRGYWPALDTRCDIWLWTYERDGQTEVGLAGPAGYSFMGMSAEGLTIPDWLALYRGWHVCYGLVGNPYVQRQTQRTNEQELLAVLAMLGLEQPVLHERLLVGSELFASYHAVHEGQDVVAVGTALQMTVYPREHPRARRPLYYCLGRRLMPTEALELEDHLG